MKQRAITSFNASKMVILMRKTERTGKPKLIKDAELEALFDEDLCQTQEELAESLGVTRSTISRPLKTLRMIRKQGK